MSDTETVGLLTSLEELDAESPEARKQRRLRVLARVEETHRRILARRGGEPIPAELIDEILDEIRGRSDADLA